MCVCKFIKKQPLMRNQVLIHMRKLENILLLGNPLGWVAHSSQGPGNEQAPKNISAVEIFKWCWVPVWCTRLCRRLFKDDLVVFLLRCYSGAQTKVMALLVIWGVTDSGCNGVNTQIYLVETEQFSEVEETKCWLKIRGMSAFFSCCITRYKSVG